MTEQLRDFLNEHRDLIETDNIYELVNGASSYSSYYKELLQLLTDCGAFENYDDFLNEFIKKFERETAAIERKCEADGFTSVLSTTRNATYDAVSLKNMIESYGKTITMLPMATGAIPPHVSTEYTPSLYLDRWEYRISLTCGDKQSSEFRCAPPSTDFFFMDILYPEKLNQHLKEYLDLYEQFCVKTNECIDNCIKSFDWIETATKYANDIAPELKERAVEYFDIDPQVVHAGNGVFIDTGLKNTKDNIRIIIPCYFNPSSFDAEEAIKDCIAKIKRLKKSQERNAQKQAEKEAQRPENYREITRRDITNALKELDIEVSGIWYTNKHSKITTYKCAMCIVTPDECKRLEDKLRSIGADVESVTCSVGGSGWRQYPSLFIKIRN